jgi:hypothetical protein
MKNLNLSKENLNLLLKLFKLDINYDDRTSRKLIDKFAICPFCNEKIEKFCYGYIVRCSSYFMNMGHNYYIDLKESYLEEYLRFYTEQDNITIKKLFDGSAEINSIIVYDIYGKLIFSKECSEENIIPTHPFSLSQAINKINFYKTFL